MYAKIVTFTNIMLGQGIMLFFRYSCFSYIFFPCNSDKFCPELNEMLTDYSYLRAYENMQYISLC